MNKMLKQKFYKTAEAKKILKCIQCGSCSGSCPLSDQMDHAPRELFALIRDGEMTEVLKSNTPWFCVSCYLCMVRCPKKIPVTNLMYELKEMALEHGLAPSSNKLPDLYQAFNQLVEVNGKVTESMLMAIFGIKHPDVTLKNIPIALDLIARKRLELLPQTIKGRGVFDIIKNLEFIKNRKQEASVK